MSGKRIGGRIIVKKNLAPILQLKLVGLEPLEMLVRDEVFSSMKKQYGARASVTERRLNKDEFTIAAFTKIRNMADELIRHCEKGELSDQVFATNSAEGIDLWAAVMVARNIINQIDVERKRLSRTFGVYKRRSAIRVEEYHSET